MALDQAGRGALLSGAELVRSAPVDERGGNCGACSGPLAYGVCLKCGQRRHGRPRPGEAEPAAEPAPQWLDVEAIVALTGWTRAYVMKRASLDGWKRKGTRPQQYDRHDVTRSAGTSRDTRVRSHLLAKYALTEVQFLTDGR